MLKNLRFLYKIWAMPVIAAVGTGVVLITFQLGMAANGRLIHPVIGAVQPLPGAR